MTDETVATPTDEDDPNPDDEVEEGAKAEDPTGVDPEEE